jgi:hypothetical protein
MKNTTEKLTDIGITIQMLNKVLKDNRKQLGEHHTTREDRQKLMAAEQALQGMQSYIK